MSDDRADEIARELLDKSCFDAGERCPSQDGCCCRSDIAAALRSYGCELLEAIAGSIGDSGHISGLDLREFAKSKPEAQDTQT